MPRGKRVRVTRRILPALKAVSPASTLAARTSTRTSPGPGRAWVYLRCVAPREGRSGRTVRHAGTGTTTSAPRDSSCEQLLMAAGTDLLARAQDEGTIRDDVTILDLLTLANGYPWRSNMLPALPNTPRD
ncbi:SbtR family transcriptional regulator [Nocardia sp. FBN12]|uniref:SbtR family transcriptional regulator n=1 Tax=Nocardia sp. FBN12 TaxID=3419766 RepID=UPI003CFF1015